MTDRYSDKLMRFLKGYADALYRAGHGALLRDYEGLPQRNHFDIDFIITEGPAAADLLEVAALSHGCHVTIQPASRGFIAFIVDTESPDWMYVELHTSALLAGYSKRLRFAEMTYIIDEGLPVPEPVWRRPITEAKVRHKANAKVLENRQLTAAQRAARMLYTYTPVKRGRTNIYSIGDDMLPLITSRLARLPIGYVLVPADADWLMFNRLAIQARAETKIMLCTGRPSRILCERPTPTDDHNPEMALREILTHTGQDLIACVKAAQSARLASGHAN